MSWTLTIIVILIGLVLITLEIVALPGGISGICGAAFLIAGIWNSYAKFGHTAGTIVLISSLAIGIILLVILMKSRTWKRFSLNEESDSRVNIVDSQTIVPGARGVTLSRLAPAGKAQIGGEIVEVHSNDGFIDENTPVEVTHTEGYQIFVKPLPTTN